MRYPLLVLSWLALAGQGLGQIIILPRISGYIKDPGGEGIDSVMVTFTNAGTTHTDSTGYYSKAVASGWTGTVRPDREGYTFNPAYRSYRSAIMANVSNQDFTGTKITYMISGYVRTAFGIGVPDVMVLFNTWDTLITNSQGYYSKIVEHGWVGIIEPKKWGFKFSPESNSYLFGVTENINDDYLIIPLDPITISGTVYKERSSQPIAGVRVRFSEGAGETYTDATGKFSHPVYPNMNNYTTYQGNFVMTHPDYFINPEKVNVDYIPADTTFAPFWGTPKKLLTILASAGTGGSIAPAGSSTVKERERIIFTVTPDPGYAIDNLVIDGEAKGAMPHYGFLQVEENHTIHATFEPVTILHTVTSRAYCYRGGGLVPSDTSIIPSGELTVNHGNSLEFRVTRPNYPGPGWYSLSEVLVDGIPVTKTADSTYTLSPITSDRSIIAIFLGPVPWTHTITALALPGGSIAPAGFVPVSQGGQKVFTITPDSGFKVLNVTVDGVAQGPVSQYTFTNINGAHTITAMFMEPTVIGMASPPVRPEGPGFNRLPGKFILYELTGRKAGEYRTDPPDRSLLSSTIRTGIYFYTLSGPDGKETGKIIQIGQGAK